MSDLEATAREAIERASGWRKKLDDPRYTTVPVPYSWHGQYMQDVPELARGVLELLEERDRLEQENNRLYEAMQNCRESNRRKGEELAGLLFRIDRAREALAPREEQ